MNVKNQVQLIGNLGVQPDVKVLDSGRKLARLSLATHEAYQNAKGETVKETQWHTVVAWGKHAEMAEKHLAKGAEVFVTGKLVSRSYTDKEGNKKYVTEVEASDIMLVSRKAEE